MNETMFFYDAALLTVNFPDVKDGSRLFDIVRGMGSNLPLLVMEFWTGWFDHWGKKHHTVPTESKLTMKMENTHLKITLKLILFISSLCKFTSCKVML